jgi:hypothetical protein
MCLLTRIDPLQFAESTFEREIPLDGQMSKHQKDLTVTGLSSVFACIDLLLLTIRTTEYLRPFINNSHFLTLNGED